MHQPGEVRDGEPRRSVLETGVHETGRDNEVGAQDDADVDYIGEATPIVPAAPHHKQLIESFAIRSAFDKGVQLAFSVFADSNGLLTHGGAAALLKFLDKDPPTELTKGRASANIEPQPTTVRGYITIDIFVDMLLSRVCLV